MRLRLWSGLLAVLLTVLAGWSALKDISPLFYLGTVGLIPTLLIEGVHGGGTHVQDMIGGAVFIVVNIVFYYFVFHWVLARASGMQHENRKNN